MLLALALGGGVARAEGLMVEPTIGGMPMTCQDFLGNAVRTMMMDDLGDVGRTWNISRMPVIALDPKRLAELPPKLQVFFYAHECAHHVLAHHFNRRTDSETEADCWAVVTGRQRGVFTREDVLSFAPFFAHSRGSPFGHLPGRERAEALVACFDTQETVEQHAFAVEK